MKGTQTRVATAAVALFFFGIAAQTARTQETTSWAPKPVRPTADVPPNRPHTKLSDLKARHAGQAEWREVIVNDEHLQGEYIASAPGSKVSKRFHPDTREWWIVVDGQMRVEIDGQAPFVATKGSIVQVPKQTIYSMETIGDKSSLRFDVNIAKAKTLYPQEVQPPRLPGFDWVRVTLNRRPAPYDNGNQPHVNLYEAAKAPGYRGGTVVHDDRADAGIIYGYEKNLPPIDPKDRGHFHPESAELWLIMAGQIRYAIENVDVFIADEGDVAYVPPSTFHLARFYGPGPSCRLSINGFANQSQLRDAQPPR